MYEALAEMQAKTGQTQEALKNYRRVLELDPKNADAAKYVKEHGERSSRARRVDPGCEQGPDPVDPRAGYAAGWRCSRHHRPSMHSANSTANGAVGKGRLAGSPPASAPAFTARAAYCAVASRRSAFCHAGQSDFA
jgi:tetratricopeptide (TPR) repeat protein